MKASDNQRITRVGPGTECGRLMRQFWQPVALLDEFDPALDPRMAQRPLKAVRLLGQDLLLWRDAQGKFALVDRACPHRGADLAFARYEPQGIRCPFHGWQFDASGQCVETPGEPTGSTLCQRIRQTTYPLRQACGVLFAWLGDNPANAPELPPLDCFVAPDSHTFAFKGVWHCNWLQAFEVGIDPAHTSFLHRFFQDASLEDSYGKQFRNASAGDARGQRWPMSRVMREGQPPDIAFEETPYGYAITTRRELDAELTHVRVTHAMWPHTFVIPLSETMTITQMHVPVDDTRTHWVSFFTSFNEPVQRQLMREQRLAGVTLPDYLPRKHAGNSWGFDPEEQRTRTYLGMGEEDINVHDQWACESMGAIQDRTKEHLGTTDKIIMANRRWLLRTLDAMAEGKPVGGLANAEVARQTQGPDTVDGIAPRESWQAWWREQVQRKRTHAPWT
ncbi:MAG: Rieske 2Fe-2S domain-containing protein [Proteobacteria bacterium]|nr:Rieske 2Fe-2S domain-containing protein [Pseudomonadota bacterium]MDA0869301.1 Rieske 2Fe-2S domain-containing protein [Pseudomonadota bacterium]MDA1327990.1 Rieske 2Fe-2S domain-containing protein [Pseudomonadota bacterium]